MECVLFSARSGLGNRLRALAGCRALADLLSIPLYVDWELNGACDASFDALFAQEGWEETHFVDRLRIDSLRRGPPHVLVEECVWFTEIWATAAEQLIPERAFYRAAVALLQRLRPAAHLQERIDTYLAGHDLGACTGVHVRSTDNLYAYQEWADREPDFSMSKVSKIDGFDALIESLTKAGESVFLTTDNPEIERAILSRFENVSTYGKDFDDSGYRRHVRSTYESHAWLRRLADRLKASIGLRASSSWRTTGMGDALIDLMLLARCREIVGTYYSSFSEVSALIGDAPLSVMEATERVPSQNIRQIRAIASGALPYAPVTEAP